ncbi:MAG: sodium:alanine symporter family protein [Bacteroidaceae bacterium]|nr:sodium:alanine symporter family protein [Bacteroidaceae bacterium]
MTDVLNYICDILWGWPMMILLVGTHIYLTIRLRFPQRYIFKAIKLSLKKDKGAEGEVSQFGALSTALAATLGTGNIIGVGTAIALGGPGAVFWCWIAGFFGIATKYAEGLLAVKYRETDSRGRVHGGPMYALEKGLGCKWAGMLFAVFTAIAAFGIGDTVQSNAISTLALKTFSIPTWVTGLTVTLLAGLVLIGGLKSISKVCTAFVPFMAIIYIVGCIAILIMNSAYIEASLKLILKCAFSPEAAEGGFLGSTMIIAARYGIARGLFSNESGMGSAPIVAATAKTRNPVRQALVSSSGTFWDTVVICALTGLVIVSSILAYNDVSYQDGGAITQLAFSHIPYIGAPLLTFALLTFSFSTILGWEIYGERAAQYLSRKGYIKVKRIGYYYRFIYVAFIYVGATVDLGTVWTAADILNALMAIPNLIALILLTGVIVYETRKYLWNNNLDEFES